MTRRRAAAPRTVVKVCGLTRARGRARGAATPAPTGSASSCTGESPRRVEPAARAPRSSRALPGAIAVAVMVAPTPDEALELARRAGAHARPAPPRRRRALARGLPAPGQRSRCRSPTDGSLTEPLPARAHLRAARHRRPRAAPAAPGATLPVGDRARRGRDAPRAAGRRARRRQRRRRRSRRCGRSAWTPRSRLEVGPGHQGPRTRAALRRRRARVRSSRQARERDA